MTDNIIIVYEHLPSKLKSLFKVWLSNKGVSDDKIAMIAMRWRIFRKNVPTSSAQQHRSIATSAQKISYPYTYC